MKPMQITFAAVTTLFSSLTLWSCNMDKTPAEPAAVQAAPEQASPLTQSNSMPGTGDGMLDLARVGCPMVVQGTDVSIADTDTGVALTFTTDADDVVDLRTRVQNMAKMYQMQRGHRGMMWHHMGGDGLAHAGRGMGGEGMGQGRPDLRDEGMAHAGHGMGGEGMGRMTGRGPMPAMSGTVTDTDKGARLELRPTDPAQLDALREQVRWHQQRMQAGECWMPQDQQTKTPRDAQR